MKMKFFAILTAFMILTLSGCGSGSNNGFPVFETSILSDPTYDGDIEFDFVTGLYDVTQGSLDTQQRVFAGLDPFSEVEYRSFLHFPLTGVNGVPGDAMIDSAHLRIFINNIDIQFPNNPIPVSIDLVSFQPPFLIESDYYNPIRFGVSVRSSIYLSDVDRHVTIDVTRLMVEAQRLGLLDFQIRIMEDLGDVSPGLIEINDTTGGNRNILAPQLIVNYF